MVEKFRIAPLLLFPISALFLATCPNIDRPKEGQKFWAYNFVTGKYYQVTADKAAVGKRCEIWVERSSGVSPADASEFAREYDEEIYPIMIENFDIGESYGGIIYGTSKFNDIMEMADYLVNGNGKLVILLLDIKDGYKTTGDPYCGGYFSSGNFFWNYPYSNSLNMIYVDTDPGMKNRDGMYATFAHELQHLINFITTLLRRDAFMDTWIDEGLSTQAEYLYLKEHPKDRYQWFIDDRAKSIAKGNNFYVWDNHQESPLSIMDEYATVYLFFQWLYLQSGEDPDLFRNIIASEQSDHQAVTKVAKEINPHWNKWETLIRDWMAANYINSPSGIYGYKHNDDEASPLKKIKVRAIGPKPDVGLISYEGNFGLDLYPGEGVYSKTPRNYIPPRVSSSIGYAGLQKSGLGSVSHKGPYNGDVLLTYNKKTIENNAESAKFERGYVTGEDGDAWPPPSPVRQAADFPYPLRIDARDTPNQGLDYLKSLKDGIMVFNESK
ncbi:MAG: hypothetical protein LBH43_09205 [Treponema sp.]|nr:hypothetical protein [Treponema sp.]